MHTLRESAAAWGAALNLIPSLGPVVEGYLKQPEGRRLVKAVKDPAQQEFFIQAWQQSGVFRSFFGDDPSSADKQDATPEAPTTSAPAMSPPIQLQQHPLASDPSHMGSASSSIIPPPRPPPIPHLAHSHSFDHLPMPKLEPNPFNFVPTPSPSSQDGGSRQRNPSVAGRNKPRQESISLSDIVAKDAVRSYVPISEPSTLFFFFTRANNASKPAFAFNTTVY